MVKLCDLISISLIFSFYCLDLLVQQAYQVFNAILALNTLAFADSGDVHLVRSFVFSTNEIGANWIANLLALVARATYYVHWSYAEATLLVYLPRLTWITSYFAASAARSGVTPLQQLPRFSSRLS